MNLDYLDLVEEMDRFNNFAWGSISFEQLHDSLLFAALRRGKGRVEGDDEGDEEEGEGEVRGTKKVQWFGWGCKGFSYAFHVICVAFIGNIGFMNVSCTIKEIILIEAVRKKAYWASGHDADVVIGENLTPGTNYVCELKMQLKELKVLFERLAHEKEISNKNFMKKVKELSNVVEELRRVVMEKPVEENTKEEDEGKKMWEKKLKKMEKTKKREKKKKMKSQKTIRQKKRKEVKRRNKKEDLGGQIGGNVQTVVEEEEKPKEDEDDGGENGGDEKSGFESYCQGSYDERNAEVKSRGRKRGCMNMATYTWQATTKLAPIAHVLLDLLFTLSRDVKKGHWPIDISPRSLQQDNGGKKVQFGAIWSSFGLGMDSTCLEQGGWTKLKFKKG
ncbi:myelin transcription factor 1-like [Pyrus ussuriensis x Pyrus communis]|uniref:Myelin transcription factor 1-like n=1 Tax=Pyrus ussuriensis x Pyrus communis TaxID=2448454 RepID=A0A5N5H3I7_9ROSA|nr:myelin transcription factor 1-like [Pyrus ussuriensis x Pyrus communis]